LETVDAIVLKLGEAKKGKRAAARAGEGDQRLAPGASSGHLVDAQDLPR